MSEKEGRYLHWLIRTTVDAIIWLINGFQDLAVHAETALTLAADYRRPPAYWRHEPR
jgi:hypothetical protein